MDVDDPFDQLAAGSRSVPRSVKVRLGVGSAAVLLIGAFATAVLVGLLSPKGDSHLVPNVSVTQGSTQPAGTPTAPPLVYVHVLGAVPRPGLYTLPSGSRVVDAVAAAGGMTDDAEPSGVNLARPLTDGEQLVVPHVGDPAQPAQGTAAAPGASSTTGGGAGGKINLNTATEEQLDSLPRVGPAMAAKILAWRTQNGRFTSVDDLMNVSGIGQKTFDGLKDLVTV